jgi:ABC-type Fe3+/spermidine/putrescine transport system ATPase subunit
VAKELGIFEKQGLDVVIESVADNAAARDLVVPGGAEVFTLKLRGMPKERREEHAVAFLKKAGLGDSLNKYPSQLSGGMRQRLALSTQLSDSEE